MKHILIAPVMALVLIIGVSIGPANSQTPDFSKVEIEAVKVADRIYMLIGQGGNIGVCIGEDGVFLIDNQFAGLTDKIVAAVAELTDQPIRFLINTHWHADHTGGNENFANLG